MVSLVVINLIISSKQMKFFAPTKCEIIIIMKIEIQGLSTYIYIYMDKIGKISKE
jgi:hypothetical protein